MRVRASTVLQRAYFFCSCVVVLIHGRQMPSGINEQVQPLQSDKEMTLPGTVSWYIFRRDRINKPALVITSLGVWLHSWISSYFTDYKTSLGTGALTAGGSLTASLHVLCAARGLLRSPPEGRTCQVTVRCYRKRGPGTEFCLPGTCRHLEMSCKLSHSSMFF